MNEEQISKLEKSIQNMKDKTARIYFLVQDTKGNAKASVRYVYQVAMTLKNNGFNSIILHEKPDYFGVESWLGNEYMENLPHKPIEGTNLEVSPEDLIIIPEIYGFVMDQITKLPCGKVVLCQAYDHIFETLNPGDTWTRLGFYKCITTSEKQKEMIESLMRGVSVDVLSPVISDCFEEQSLPPKTIVTVHTRDHRETVNLIKAFYARFPQYRWITFRDMRGLSEVEFANAMKESFCSVWMDSTSGFGTYPLESFKMGIPVIGLVPNLVPEWMNEDNGIWINNPNMMIDVIADFIQNWLEDNISPVIFEGMKKTISEYTDKNKFELNVVTLFDNMFKTRLSSFEDQLSKFETIE
jgi:hypothetical protein